MKSINQIKKEQFEIQRAIKFLIDCCLDKKGNQKINNPKPVVAHSLRMGFDLLKREYDKNIIIGAILHDIKEDAGVSIKKIEKRFGKKVAQIVDAVSCDLNIADWREKYSDIYRQIIKVGREAIIVSIADYIDNADYYKFAKSRLAKKQVREMWQMFSKELKKVGSEIKDEPIYKEFKEKMKNL